MQKENQSKANITGLAEQTKNKIIDYINESYNKLPKIEKNLCLKDIENWKNSIQLKINEETKKLILSFQKNKGFKIESKSELKTFSSKDIQDENKEITRKFQNEAYKYLSNSNEKIENEYIALFFKEAARISRIAYSKGKILLKKMKEEYIKNKGGKILINENDRKEFSSWIKNYEKENGRKEYKNIIGQVKLFEKVENNEEQKYLSQLFNDLFVMYFHCDLSCPIVSINFKKEENFNPNEMIDFVNTGKNRKVNFIILPSLFSNGIFLENGKSWVFTYHKDTFKFEDLIIESLNKLIQIPFTIKVYSQIENGENIVTIDTNDNLFENKNYEIYLHLINKENNEAYCLQVKEKTFKIDKNQEIKKYEVKKILISSENIIIKKNNN